MRVYLSCHHPGPANEAAATLSAAGHEVVSTWHSSNDPRPAREDSAAWRRSADRNIEQIRSADVLALIASPDHLSGAGRVPGGKFFEAGFAFGFCARTAAPFPDEPEVHAVRVVTIGGVENGMLNATGVEHVADVTGLVAALATLATVPG